jgi:CRP/FNR family transcriptional regulator
MRLTHLSDRVGVSAMPSVRQLAIHDTPRALTGRVRTDFHSLLHEIHTSSTKTLNSLHTRGKVLFAEGEPAAGIFILRTGRATESISSSEGRVLILRVPQGGDVLGVNSVLQNSAYDTTVKTIEPCRTDFINLMDRSRSATCAILRMLSCELTEAANRSRFLLLPQTARAKLARLLLQWCEEYGEHKALIVQIHKNFTHEEIAQMICSSRETVTRLLSNLSRRQILQVTPDSILIYDRQALRTMALH